MKATEITSTPKAKLSEKKNKLRRSFLLRIQRRRSLVETKKELGTDLEE